MRWVTLWVAAGHKGNHTLLQLSAIITGFGSSWSETTNHPDHWAWTFSCSVTAMTTKAWLDSEDNTSFHRYYTGGSKHLRFFLKACASKNTCELDNTCEGRKECCSSVCRGLSISHQRQNTGQCLCKQLNSELAKGQRIPSRELVSGIQRRNKPVIWLMFYNKNERVSQILS